MNNIDGLITQLQDPNPDVRSGAVKALAKSGDREPLITVLQDESELV